MKLNYDQKFDVLYVLFADTGNSYGDDSEAGIIYLRDLDTDSLTGIAISNFRRGWASGTLPELSGDTPASYDEIEQLFQQIG